MIRTGLYTRYMLVSVAAIAAALRLAGCGDKKEQQQAAPPAVPVQVVEAVQRDVPLFKEWVGQTYGSVDIELRARVDGWLQGIHFREGTEVKKGDLLYTIDQTELREAVARAEAQVAEKNTMLARAEGDVSRYVPLSEAGAVSRRQLDIAVAERDAYKSEVDAARAALNEKLVQLSYASIRAPIDGLIGISAARVGDYVGRPPNTIILNTISRVDSIHVKFSLSEQEYLDLARRTLGQAGTGTRPRDMKLELILADGSGYPLPGKPLFAQRQIDPATGTLQVEASFPNPQRLLRPGQFGRIRVMFDERASAVVVPVRSVTEIQGQYSVYAVGADNKVQLRRIKRGPVVGQLQVVDEGVAPGEKVIVEGIQRARPGVTVNPTTVPMPSDTTAAAAAGGR